MSRTCAVFIGPSSVSPWEHVEMRRSLAMQVQEDDFCVIPVLLPGASLPPPGTAADFLPDLSWVDFRNAEEVTDDEMFRRLVAGIRGGCSGPG